MAHFVTGGTGFVGSCLVLELLLQSDAPIYCLVRGDDPTRLRTTLGRVAALYGYPKDIVADIRERCHAVAGDLTADGCGIVSPLPGAVERFWHSAASLAYEDRYRDEIFAVNVTGTRSAVALARALGARAFNYISTAYVAGTRTGVIEEGPVEDRRTNNLYELSKIQAEEIVAGADAFRTRILRPSIVVGHSKTHGAINFSGMYGFLRKLARFKVLMNRINEEFIRRETLQIKMDPEVPLNLVPVDHVARQAIQIGLSEHPSRYFHLTNSAPPLTATVMDRMFQELEIRQPRYVPGDDEFTWIDRKFGGMVDFYSSYLVGEKVFDRTQADAALGRSDLSAHPYDSEQLAQMYRWYLQQLAFEKRGSA